MLKLYQSERSGADASKFGCDLRKVFSLLDALETSGLRCDRVNTDGWSDDQLADAYLQAIGPAVSKKVEIRRTFGSRKSAGFLFGRQVPALIVLDGETNRPIDVYPHRERGQKIEITDYLESCLERR